ncbi:MAG: hypothetical protein ACK471_11815 [Dolichospermum sp.]
MTTEKKHKKLYSKESTREQGTGNREQGTGNREQGTGNRHHPTPNTQNPTPNKKQPKLNITLHGEPQRWQTRDFRYYIHQLNWN